MLIEIIIGTVVISFLFYIRYTLWPTFLSRRHQHKDRKNYEGDNVIYLTFDDGPSKEYTEELLDLLKKESIKASFFVVGTFAESYPYIIKRMREEGHLIGLHSNRHKCSYLQGPAETEKEWHSAKNKLNRVGVEIKYYRPPWGMANSALIRYADENNWKLTMWDVMAEDWQGHTTADIIKEKLIARTKKGDIVCLHDGRGKNEAPSKTIKALETVIPYWIEKGYRFETVDKRTI